MEKILDNIWNWLITEGIKVILGLIALFVLFKLINIITRKLEKALSKNKVDKTVTITVISIMRKVLKILLIVVFLTFIGIETSSISAVIASIGLTVGLSLQGSLSNLAGGIILLVLRPFKIGDFIECNDGSGTVEKIELFFTYIVTPDNKVIMVPNSTLSNGKIINYNAKKTRRLDLMFSIDYNVDFKKAKLIILNCIKESNLYLVEPEPFVKVKAHGASSIDIVVRVWVKSKDYWDLNFYLQEAIKEAFDNNNISIPFPQMDVHIKNDDANASINYNVPNYSILTNAGENITFKNAHDIEFNALAPTKSQLERFDDDEEAFRRLIKGTLFKGKTQQSKNKQKKNKKTNKKNSSAKKDVIIDEKKVENSEVKLEKENIIEEKVSENTKVNAKIKNSEVVVTKAENEGK